MKKLFILVLALVMVFAALPAFAQQKADWSFYGSVRMWTSYDWIDTNTPPALSSSTLQPGQVNTFQIASTPAVARIVGGQAQDDSELEWLMQSNSRIGAKVAWGNIGGAFEYGHGSGNAVQTRLLYGTWNFGSGTFLVGQDYGPYFYLVSGLCGPGGGECNGIGFGSIYSSRTPQLKLIFGGFQVSLESPVKTGSFHANQPPLTITDQELPLFQFATANVPTDNDQTLPRIAASYTFNMGPGQFFIGGIYNTYTQHFGTTVDVENDVNAWLLGAGTKLGFGPFYVNATFQYGYNPNNAAGPFFTLYPSAQYYSAALDKSEDSKYMAAQLILGFKLTDSMTFEGGVIWQSGEVDNPDVSGNNIKQDTWSYYIGMGFSPAKNVFIVPELGLIDYNKLKTNSGDVSFGNLTWFGIKWQINF